MKKRNKEDILLDILFAGTMLIILVEISAALAQMMWW